MSATTNKVSTFSGKFLSWIDNNTYEITNEHFNTDEQSGRQCLHNDDKCSYSSAYTNYLDEMYYLG